MARNLIKINEQLEFIGFAMDMHRTKQGQRRSEFETRFLSMCGQGWEEVGLKEKVPDKNTIRRWFKGDTSVSNENRNGVVKTIALITQGRVKFEEADLTKSVHDLATKYDKSLDEFNEWKRIRDEEADDKQTPALVPRRGLNDDERQVLREIGGVSLSYRHHTKDRRLRRTVLVVRENAVGSGIEIALIGPSGNPWRGRLTVGSQTLTARLERTGRGQALQVNTISIFDEERPSGIYAGIRTRVSDGALKFIAAYRLLIVRRKDLDPLVSKGSDLRIFRAITKELDLDGDDVADTNRDGQSPYEVISNLLRTQNPTDAQGVPYGRSPGVFMFYLHTDGIDPESIFDPQVSADRIKP